MAEGGEKTEAPTAKRRADARRKGDFLSSRELQTAVTGMGGALWLAMFGASLVAAVKGSFRASLSIARSDIAAFRPVEALLAAFAPFVPPMAALGGIAIAGAILSRAVTGGITFNPGLIAPKPGRLDPVAGLKRMFGIGGVIELLKALLKAVMLVAITFLLLRTEAPRLAALSATDYDAALETVGAIALRLVLWLSFGLFLIGAADLPVQILQWLKKLKMSRQEVRDEFKQQEGSPELKHAIRRMARDNLKRASRASMADATVVLTNPTHFAVALRYRPGIDAAPVIVARGRGMLADVIRELAAEGKVPLLSYPSVARAVYFTGRVGQAIRPDLYQAAAAILAFVLRVGADLADRPEVEAPDTARFDENGRRTTG